MLGDFVFKNQKVDYWKHEILKFSYSQKTKNVGLYL
jgi:hypothetical protein